MRTLLLVLFAVLGPLAPAPPVAAQDGGWPFAAEERLGAKLDLYNLGLLGAKACDDELGLPAQGGTGRRQVQSSGFDGNDDGPERLRIVLLLPDGPAERAGLNPGDVIVAAGGKKFAKKGSFAPLAKALAKAAATGVVELKVERAEGGKAEKLTVELEKLGKEASKPSSAAARELFGGRSLSWLADRQNPDGGFTETLSGVNGAVCQTAVAGLAWIAGGSSLDAGEHKENLERAVEFVRANVGAERGPGPQGGANWSQVNWGWAHAAVFLGELHARSPRPELLADVERCAEALQRNQERSGGYAHGPGGPNALDYVELNIVTGLALCGLGLARQAGVELDEEKLEAARDYIEASSGGGGVGYSTKGGQAGQGNIGRTAATWLGYRALGLHKNKMCTQMASYVKRNAGNVMGGHASLMQHVLLAGLASQTLGGGAAKAFWSDLERDCILAMAPDGSFQPRPWHESLTMSSNSDVSFGEVWTTAAWALVLLCEPNADGTRGLTALCKR
jgi:membrane-associated protease RseP (regulator of RpoE activity)